MQFHNSVTGKPHFIKQDTVSFTESIIQQDPDDLPNGYALSFMSLSEYCWHGMNRPYYNVFPVVSELVEKVPLDITWADVKLPFAPLSVRFPVGMEPYGISSFTVSRSGKRLARATDDGKQDFDYYLRDDGVCYVQGVASDVDEIEGFLRMGGCCFIPNKKVHPKVRSAALSLIRSPVYAHIEWKDKSKNFVSGFWTYHHEKKGFKDLTIEEALVLESPKEQVIPYEVTNYVVRCTAFLALLSQGNDYITPALLKRDAKKYESADEMARKKMEERASNLNGRGFNIGQELQRQADRGERSPHYRRPHAAIVRCGKQWQERKLIIRAGSIVTPKHLSEVPTGFLGPETKEELEAPKVDRKKYFRPHIPKRMRFNVLRRDGFACRYCGLSPNNCEGVVLHADHIVSVNDGGATTEDNLITACDCCNLGKWKDSLSPQEIQQFCDQFAFDNKHPKRIKKQRRAKQHTPH